MKGGGRPKMVKLHEGMKSTMTKAPSGSMTKGGSVDKGATRGKTAPTPRTLGGREA